MDRAIAHDDTDAPARAGALSCATTPLPVRDLDGSVMRAPARRREDVLRQLEQLGLAELERLAATRQQPGDDPDLLASFIEWDLAVRG